MSERTRTFVFNNALIILLVYSLLLSSSCATNESENGASLAAAALLLLENQTDGQSCPSTTLPDGVYLADTVTSAPAASDDSYKDPALATNGICGGGTNQGSTDVYSLDQTGEGATLVLEWKGLRVTDGPGVDFIVFENAFEISGPSDAFMEPAVVEVSIDGNAYCGFSPDYTYSPETDYSSNPSHWVNFAGTRPVLLHQDESDLTASAIFTDSNGDGFMDQAGGNGFDLANLSNDSAQFSNGCTDDIKNSIKNDGFVYLRITAAANLENPDSSGNKFPVDSENLAGGPDIDGVLARTVTSR